MRILRESKESTLKRQVLLTDEQREYLIKLFNKYNYLWSLLPSDKLNKGTLEWKDCKDIIEQVGKSKTARKKKGITGLKEGYDYIFLGEGFNETIGNYLMYQPLTYKGSKVLASNSIEPKKESGAQWCVAYQKDYIYWRHYSYKDKCKFIYLMTEDTKYAIAKYPNKVEVFTFEDKNIKYPSWCKKDKVIQKAMKELKEPQPIKEINLKDYIVKNQDGTVSLSLIKKGIYLEEGDYKIAGKFTDIINSYIKDGRFTVKFKDWDLDFDCSYMGLTSLEGCPDYVRGDFSCNYCDNLTSLKGAPREVSGTFTCMWCKNLTSLDGAPEKVGGDFYCKYCDNLISLEGASKEVGRRFDCRYCDSLTSLKGAPEKVGEIFYCDNCNNLTSLQGAPKEVGKDFDCRSCPRLISLQGAPKEVGRGFICNYCDNLTSLQGAPEKVGGNFLCYYCVRLTSLKGAPKEVGGDFDCTNCHSLISLEGAPEKIGGKFIHF